MYCITSLASFAGLVVSVMAESAFGSNNDQNNKPSAPKWEVGTRVIHEKRGRGTVISHSGDVDGRVSVIFNDGDIRRYDPAVPKAKLAKTDSFIAEEEANKWAKQLAAMKQEATEAEDGRRKPSSVAVAPPEIQVVPKIQRSASSIEDEKKRQAHAMELVMSIDTEKAGGNLRSSQQGLDSHMLSRTVIQNSLTESKQNTIEKNKLAVESRQPTRPSPSPRPTPSPHASQQNAWN